MTNMEQLTKSDDKNVKLFANTITNLAGSQGFYGRLWRDINEMEQEQLDELINEVKKQNFKETLDVVLWLEC